MIEHPSWADAERRFPEASVAWDRDGGPAWLRDRPCTTIVILAESLAIGCNDREPYGWAFWIPAQGRWVFTQDWIGTFPLPAQEWLMPYGWIGTLSGRNWISP